MKDLPFENDSAALLEACALALAESVQVAGTDRPARFRTAQTRPGGAGRLYRTEDGPGPVCGDAAFEEALLPELRALSEPARAPAGPEEISRAIERDARRFEAKY